MAVRLRFWMLLAAMVAVELVIAIWIGYGWMRGPRAGADPGWPLLMGGAGVFAVVAFQALLWAWLDLRLFQPLQVLERSLEIMLRHPGHEPEIEGAGLLGGLPEGIRNLGAALSDARQAVRGAAQVGAQRERIQRMRLEEIVRALREGLVVCDERARVLLYNPAAVALLGSDGALGLGRGLHDILPRGALDHALALLRYRRDQGRRSGRAGFLFPVGAAGTVQCRVALLPRHGDGERAGRGGFVVTLEDVGPRYRAVRREHDALRAALHGLEEGFRRLSRGAERGRRADRQPTEVGKACEEGLGPLRMEVDRVAGVVRGLATSHWMLQDLYAADLVQLANRDLGGDSRVHLVMRGEALWLRGDCHGLTALLSALARMAHSVAGVRTLELRTRRAGARVALVLQWPGPPLSARDVHRVMAQALDTRPAGRRLSDVLAEHGGELRRLDGLRAGWAGMSVLAPGSDTEVHPAEGGGGVEAMCHDFDLAWRVPLAGPLLEVPLRRLDYVVFDTETTGLRPSAGDELVSIGALRIVNQKILSGETFDRLVRPRRPIPASSSRFHGITDEQVAHEPPVEDVLPLFRRFAGDAVLVAYDAAFDLKFLRAAEHRAGVCLENPVLDVLLLSVLLHGHLPDHGLDAIARRLGVEVSGRHSALGDARVTARILLALVELLERRGITTLGAALAACDKLAALRRRQALL